MIFKHLTLLMIIDFAKLVVEECALILTSMLWWNWCVIKFQGLIQNDACNKFNFIGILCFYCSCGWAINACKCEFIFLKWQMLSGILELNLWCIWCVYLFKWFVHVSLVNDLCFFTQPDGFLSWWVELAVKPVVILRQHFL